MRPSIVDINPKSRGPAAATKGITRIRRIRDEIRDRVAAMLSFGGWTRSG